MSRTVRLLPPMLASAALLSMTDVATAAPPTCPGGTYVVAPGGQILLPMDPCSDPENDPYTIEVVSPPTRGSLLGFAYIAGADQYGEDSFVYRAVVSELEQSPDATVDILINTTPRCDDATLNTSRDVSLVLPEFPCSDPDEARGSAPHDIWYYDPLLGAVTESGSALVYTPPAQFVGTDTMGFYAEDEHGFTSDEQMFTIQVAAPPSPLPRSTLPASPAPRVAPVADATAPVVSLRSGRRRLGPVRRRGLKLEISSNERARMSVKVTVDRATARRLGVARRPKGPVTVGSLLVSEGAGTRTITVPLTRRARRALANAERVKLAVRLRATDRAGNATTERLTVALRR